MFGRIMAKCSFIAAASSFCLSAFAMAESPTSLDVPAGELTAALKALALQARVDLVYQPDQVKHIHAEGVKGEYSPQEAVAILLKGTSLRVYATESGAMVIAPASAPRKTSWNGEVKGVRVAQAENVRGATESAGGQDASVGKPNGESVKLEEILITAQKRGAERLRDVPISVSVLSGEDLDKSSAADVTEALNSVPGVSAVHHIQTGGTAVAVRGVAANGPIGAGTSPIAYYLDSIPFGLATFSIAPDASSYDLERVEVLRGPQGTLYGASAQNGVVRVLTKDANLDQFEFKTRGSISSTQDGSEGYRGDAALNVPLIEGKLAARAVVGYQELGGWVDRPDEKDANDGEIRSLRLKINAQPVDGLSLGLSAWQSRVDVGGPSVSDDNQQRQAIYDEAISNDYDAYGLKMSYQASGFSITSMTSYLDYESHSVLDIIGSSPFFPTSTPLFTDVNADLFAEEVNLNSTHDGSWRWSIGGIYRNADERAISRLPTFSPLPLGDNNNQSKSFAVFGELTRLFLDGRVELTGGLRYFEDELKLIENPTNPAVPASSLLRDEATFDAVSPRLVLTWHPGTDLTLYASYAEGFRSGFLQSVSTRAADPTIPPADPDTLKNYELGAKGALWDGRVRYDTAVYFMDWQDVQQQAGIGFASTAMINGESASGVGVDFALQTQPIDGLDLGVNFSWNDLQMDADLYSSGLVLFAKGDRLNFSPEYTIGASADYRFPIAKTGFNGQFSISANAVGPQAFRTIANGVQSIAGGGAITVVRASFVINAPEHWAVTLFADNINNERDAIYGGPYTSNGADTTRRAADWNQRVRPPTIGVQFDYRF